jgi:hypothetical protein
MPEISRQILPVAFNITVFKPKNCNRSPREREAEAKATKLTNTTKAIIVLVLCLA